MYRVQTMHPPDLGVIRTNVQTKHIYLCKYANGSSVRIKFSYSKMQSTSSSSVAGSSCELILGQGEAGTVRYTTLRDWGQMHEK
jgi:hypothetical protein